MQYLSANTAAPFAMSRCGNEPRTLGRGLGELDPQQAETLVNSAGSIIAKIESIFGIGGGRLEANQITPIANDIHYKIFAPIAAALDNGSTLSYQNLQTMWNSLVSTEDRWLTFLHTTDWNDGRAATQAERDFAPYFSSYRTRIAALLGRITGNITVGGVIIPGVPNTGGGYLPTLPGGFMDTLQGALPFILAGAFIFMLPKIGKRG